MKEGGRKAASEGEDSRVTAVLGELMLLLKTKVRLPPSFQTSPSQ